MIDNRHQSYRSYESDPLAWHKGGETISWQGHRLFTRCEGEGTPLLLLHGFPTSSWDWKDVWPELVVDHRLITFDYLGFGFSDKPRDFAYSIFAYADQAEAVLRHYGVTECHVLAHDLGDTVAQELLCRRGALTLRTVALLNGGIFPETHHPRFVQKLLNSPLGFLAARLINRAAFSRSLRAVFGPRTPPSDADLDGFWQGVVANDGLRNYHKLIRYMRERRLHRERWVAPLLEPSVPIVFIDGLADPVSGQHVVRRYKELRPDAEIVELPDIGHYPQTEAPALVLEGYRAFRRRHETKRG